MGRSPRSRARSARRPLVRPRRDELPPCAGAGGNVRSRGRSCFAACASYDGRRDTCRSCRACLTSRLAATNYLLPLLVLVRLGVQPAPAPLLAATPQTHHARPSLERFAALRAEARRLRATLRVPLGLRARENLLTVFGVVAAAPLVLALDVGVVALVAIALGVLLGAEHRTRALPVVQIDSAFRAAIFPAHLA